ncbi:hypothetical protein L228DRAFT_282010 [Xylona heveae TC161]|uniref:Myb-like DNA-binding domain-containing protein n=1 Tax=Xylona heveae (strain CBS 132557 / TC161) TaxID=1328760 RepID=A0A165HBV6_XYLHT|nr:hypothetical protein L228DRAFT_282010 [Xylona heveae TC161]KZF23272.1 hypothetical protein L228DRAFT_282010 [Xylona heveae TC161]
MPPKLQLDENLLFLYTCLQHSDYKAIDFSSVGEAIGLKAPAARMRFTRLRKAIESGISTIGTATPASPGSSSSSFFVNEDLKNSQNPQNPQDSKNFKDSKGFTTGQYFRVGHNHDPEGGTESSNNRPKLKKRKKQEQEQEQESISVAAFEINNNSIASRMATNTRRQKTPKATSKRSSGRKLEPTEDLDPIQTRSGSSIQRIPPSGTAEYKYKAEDRYASDAESDTEMDVDADLMQEQDVDTEGEAERNVGFGDEEGGTAGWITYEGNVGMSSVGEGV